MEYTDYLWAPVVFFMAYLLFHSLICLLTCIGNTFFLAFSPDFYLLTVGIVANHRVILCFADVVFIFRLSGEREHMVLHWNQRETVRNNLSRPRQSQHRFFISSILSRFFTTFTLVSLTVRPTGMLRSRSHPFLVVSDQKLGQNLSNCALLTDVGAVCSV